MEFVFHANLAECDQASLYLGFAERSDGEPGHYLVMQRSEERMDDEHADAGSVYIERDDQGWGGFGGIERVSLDRSSLTIRLTTRMIERIGGYDALRTTFDTDDARFAELREVLGLIMCGYENRLQMRL